MDTTRSSHVRTLARAYSLKKKRALKSERMNETEIAPSSAIFVVKRYSDVHNGREMVAETGDKHSTVTYTMRTRCKRDHRIRDWGRENMLCNMKSEKWSRNIWLFHFL